VDFESDDDSKGGGIGASSSKAKGSLTSSNALGSKPKPTAPTRKKKRVVATNNFDSD
jgi:hypothetical protein